MNSFVLTMNKNVIMVQPYKGNPEKVKEIRNSLIENNRKHVEEFHRLQHLSYLKLKDKFIK